MDSFLIKIYLCEINTQCNYALQAITEFNACLRQNDTKGFFRAVHSFLTHASNISKLLWPVKERGKLKYQRATKRAEFLRNYLDLPEDHILKNRELRNHLEHYGERLDDWVEKSSRHNYIDHNIDPRNMFSGVEQSDIMRHFDPSIILLSSEEKILTYKRSRLLLTK